MKNIQNCNFSFIVFRDFDICFIIMCITSFFWLLVNSFKAHSTKPLKSKIKNCIFSLEFYTYQDLCTITFHGEFGKRVIFFWYFHIGLILKKKMK